MCVCVCVRERASLSHVLTFCNPMDCSPTFSIHGILQTRILEWDPLLQGVFLIEPRSPTLQADSLLPEPTGKPL